jgi:hypothetical protein
VRSANPSASIRRPTDGQLGNNPSQNCRKSWFVRVTGQMVLGRFHGSASAGLAWREAKTSTTTPCLQLVPRLRRPRVHKEKPQCRQGLLLVGRSGPRGTCPQEIHRIPTGTPLSKKIGSLLPPAFEWFASSSKHRTTARRGSINHDLKSKLLNSR